MIDDFAPNPDKPDDPKAAPARPGHARALPTARRFGLRGLMVMVALMAVLVRIALAAGPAVSIALLVVLVLSMVAGALCLAVQGRSIRRDPLLWVLAGSAERGLPLEPGLATFGALSGGIERIRARAILRLIEQGATPSEAFGRVPSLLPVDALVFLRMGWNGDRLGRALRDLIRRRGLARPYRNATSARLAYLIWTVFVMQFIVSFLLYWIAPQFAAIFADFGVPLPRITAWIIGITSGTRLVGWLLVGLLLEFVLLAFVAIVTADPLHWNIAPIDWLLLRRHASTVLRALSGEVALGRPLPEALTRIAAAYPSGVVRRRLRKAAARIGQGMPWPRALRIAGFVRRPDAALLDAAARAGNLDWALGELADAQERRIGFRLAALGQILFPISLLIVATPVFVLAVTYFYPLVVLIQALVP